MGYADAGGTIRDGAYWTNLGAEIHIGEVDGKPSEKLEKVKALFIRADMKPDVQDTIVHWLWQHAASAVGFALGYAKHNDIKTFLKDKELLHQYVRSTKELYRLCELRGVDLKKYPESSFVNFPDWLVTALVKRISATAKPPSVIARTAKRRQPAGNEGLLRQHHENGERSEALSFPIRLL